MTNQIINSDFDNEVLALLEEGKKSGVLFTSQIMPVFSKVELTEEQVGDFWDVCQYFDIDIVDDGDQDDDFDMEEKVLAQLIEELTPSAEEGDSKSILAIANGFYNLDSQYDFIQTTKYFSKETIFKWYLKAAEISEIPKFQKAVSSCYYFGDGTKQDKDKALFWGELAAASGDAEAQNDVADIYLDRATDSDNEKAFYWLRKSAEQKFRPAFRDLGKCYEYGIGTDINYDKAFESYQYVDDNFLIGCLYFNQLGRYNDRRKAYYYFRKEENKKVSRWCGQLPYYLGACYEEGIGVPRDFTKAFNYYHTAITKSLESNNEYELGTEWLDSWGCYLLGRCYLNGTGVDENKNEAFKYYLISAQNGFKGGQVGVAYLYEKGIGCTQNFDEAFLWYSKAADTEDGDDIAEYNIGYYYEIGRAVPVSIEEAQKWYKLSADKGNEDSIKALERLKITSVCQVKNDARLKQEYMNSICATHSLEEFNRMEERLKTIEQKLNEVDKKVDVIKNLLTKTLPEFIKEECGRINSELKNIEELESRSIEQIDRQEELIYQWITKTNEYICNNTSGRMERVENELKEIFGDLWNQLDDFTRRSLKSSHLLWNQCKEYQYDYDFDFSGVCITATAALEKILGDVFMFEFQDYLIDSGISMQEWPTPLKYWDEKKHKYIRNKKFMMGNLVYIIGYINKNVNGNYVLCDIYDDPSKWNDSQRQCLNDYLTYIVNSESKSGALRNRFTQPIYNDNVTSFIDKCEYIRLHYRNEAAHTHNINYETAERCHCDILEAINSVIIKLFEIVDINKINFSSK